MTIFNTPPNEHAARGRLTFLWFAMLALNVAVVLGTYLLGGFGGLRDGNTQTTLLKAFDSVFFVFAPNVTAIFTYWFALRDEKDTPLRNVMAFRISSYASLLWGVIITTLNIFGGPAVYESGLQTLSAHSNWLISGALAFYFASGKRAAGRQAKAPTAGKTTGASTP
jgi:hypothetical protein